jgi:hypothetical protein
MNPSSISNLSNTYMQSFLSNLQSGGSGKSGGSPLSAQNNSTPDSTFADLMSTIQQLQSDPTGSAFPTL